VTSPPIIVTTPNNDSTQSAELLYGFNVTQATITNHRLYRKGTDIALVRECFEKNLQDAKRVFGQKPFIASNQALLEYQEFQKVVPKP
jgi:hypothetical protein